jgi:hypothetical protein
MSRMEVGGLSVLVVVVVGALLLLLVVSVVGEA